MSVEEIEKKLPAGYHLSKGFYITKLCYELRVVAIFLNKDVELDKIEKAVCTYRLRQCKNRE